MDQPAIYTNRSHRQTEHLFEEQLDRSPQRYYLELRLIEARPLLQHTGS